MSPGTGVAEAIVDSSDACLGGSAGGMGRGASVVSIIVIGLSATPIWPSGRTEYAGGSPDLPLGGSRGGMGFESGMVVPVPNLGICGRRWNVTWKQIPRTSIEGLGISGNAEGKKKLVQDCC